MRNRIKILFYNAKSLVSIMFKNDSSARLGYRYYTSRACSLRHKTAFRIYMLSIHEKFQSISQSSIFGKKFNYKPPEITILFFNLLELCIITKPNQRTQHSKFKLDIQNNQ